LRDGMWTTRELRERERQTLSVAKERASERTAPVQESTLREAIRESQRELRGTLTGEQREALERITGAGGVSVLVGQAGTGKGVVIETAVRAWRQEGYTVLGTAVAGATAERLGNEAKLERALTSDSLIAKAGQGQLSLDRNTVVVMDEAGMADTKRLGGLVQLASRSQSKLLLVGDQAQLSAIGPGGMFTALQEEVPTAELKEVHRAREGWERQAWQQLREGQGRQALANYQAHDRLHVADTREEAAREMVEAWAKDRADHPGERTVMLTDASNRELDAINQQAQEHRARSNELGAERIELADRPYDLASGDEVMFTSMMMVHGQARVENGTLATVTATEAKENRITVRAEGEQSRELEIRTNEFSDLRLAYAQHVYKAQGVTVERAHTMIGGWQTDRERAYVALSRARAQTDIYLSREDLGEQGLDPEGIERLAEIISESHAQEPSIATPARDPARELTHARDREPSHEHESPAEMLLERDEFAPTQTSADLRESEAAQIMRETQEPQPHARDEGWDQHFD
jgi:ATP-dependent exoDNAse (exonuclease V) alpha subunit